MYVYAYLCVDVYMSVYMCMYVHVCKQPYMYVCMCMYVHVCKRHQDSLCAAQTVVMETGCPCIPSLLEWVLMHTHTLVKSQTLPHKITIPHNSSAGIRRLFSHRCHPDSLTATVSGEVNRGLF